MSRFEMTDNSSPHQPHSVEAPVPYAAVPLDMAYDDRLAYWMESVQRIRRKLAETARRAIEARWVQPELAGRVGNLLEQSLVSSHEKRVTLNQRYGSTILEGHVDSHDERIVRARRGEAMPMDLLSVLRDYPGLQSIELAKLSHPLDICATEAMDHDVCQTIMYLGGKIELGEPRYKPKTPDQVIPALTVLRKQKVGELLTRHGEIDVIRRQAFLVRGDYEAHAVTDNLDLGQLIIGYALEPKDMYFQPIAQKMEGYIPHLKNHENLKWLQPIATSYYAKYVAAPNKAQK